MKIVFLLISQNGLKNVCISTRLLLQAILCVNLSKISGGCAPDPRRTRSGRFVPRARDGCQPCGGRAVSDDFLTI